MTSLYNQYFMDYSALPSFHKEFVSLWDGWLGEEKYHELDHVTETEWARFNNLIKAIHRKYPLLSVSHGKKTLSKIENLGNTLVSFTESHQKSYTDFYKFVQPELECIITEEWDYTYIIWHKNNGAIEKLRPIVIQSQLKYFTDD